MPRSDSSDIRPSPLAGLWYPARANDLRTMLENFFEQAAQKQTHSPPPAEGITGLLVPHAGLRYSGPVAAHAFAAVRGQAFERVVIIGPLHYQLPTSGLKEILTTAHTAYETPLGIIPVDQEAIAALAHKLPLSPIRADPEHSIEIELPFLQHILAPDFRLIPIMLRDQSQQTARNLADALAEILHDRRTLVLASSDLSHFYPQEVAQQLDSKMLTCVAAMDGTRVIEYDETGVAFACGHGAIATVIYMLQSWGKARADVMNYATSGDVNGDYERVVGYGAATFAKEA